MRDTTKKDLFEDHVCKAFLAEVGEEVIGFVLLFLCILGKLRERDLFISNLCNRKMAKKRYF